MHGIGVNESLDSIPVYGLGNSEFGFISQGNVIMNGFIDINIIHIDYLKRSIEFVYGSNVDTKKEKQKEKITIAEFKQMSASDVTALAYAESKNTSGKINSMYRDFDISIILNNSNPSRQDNTSSRLDLKNLVIIGSSLNIISEQDGQLVNRYFFMGKRK